MSDSAEKLPGDLIHLFLSGTAKFRIVSGKPPKCFSSRLFILKHRTKGLRRKEKPQRVTAK